MSEADKLTRLLEAQAAELAQARRTAEFWKANHLRGNAEIDRLTAELERIKAAADRLVNNQGWGTVTYTDGQMWTDAIALRDVLAAVQRKALS